MIHEDAMVLRGALLHLRHFLGELDPISREDLVVVEIMARSEQWLRALPSGADIDAVAGRHSRHRVRTR